MSLENTHHKKRVQRVRHVQQDNIHRRQQPLKIVKTALPESTTQLKDKIHLLTAKTVRTDRFSHNQDNTSARIVLKENTKRPVLRARIVRKDCTVIGLDKPAALLVHPVDIPRRRLVQRLAPCVKVANIRHNRGKAPIRLAKIVQKVSLQMRLDKQNAPRVPSADKQAVAAVTTAVSVPKENMHRGQATQIAPRVLTVSIKLWLSSQVAMYARMESSRTMLAKRIVRSARSDVSVHRRVLHWKVSAKIVLLVGYLRAKDPKAAQYVLRGHIRIQIGARVLRALMESSLQVPAQVHAYSVLLDNSKEIPD